MYHNASNQNLQFSHLLEDRLSHNQCLVFCIKIQEIFLFQTRSPLYRRMPSTNTDEWLDLYASTFHDLYWTGPKRALLEKARKLAGPEDYILHVIAAKSSRHIYHFIDQKTISQDAANFSDLSIGLPDGTMIKGLNQILKVTEAMREMFADKFVLAFFDVINDDETVTRITRVWVSRH